MRPPNFDALVIPGGMSWDKHLVRATPAADRTSPEADAVFVMIHEAREKLVKVEQLRREEWQAARKMAGKE